VASTASCFTRFASKTVPIREAGDSALLLELDEVINVSVNARVVAIAAAVRRAALPGVRDVIPTYRSVAVHFDPLSIDVETVRDTLRRSAADATPDASEGKTVVIPVQYGGDMGPDLRDVAAFAGMSADEVVARHTAARYRVFMLGFLPGFAYMGSVDEAIAMPRHATPRLKVPGGSVGIAGRQTGVYPRESPGGWRLIGRTPVSLFSPHRVPASLVAPGDTVRFVRDKIPVVSGFSRTSPRPPEGGHHARSVTVLRPGLFTTIQDDGRWGHQASGVPVSGPMDRLSHRMANALVGNEQTAALLEATLAGPEVRIDNGAVLAVTGADLGARLDSDVVPLHRPVRCRPGTVLRFSERRMGARAYIAFSGGITVPAVLGSRATHTQCGLGGVHGRMVAAGDRLPLGEERAVSPWRVISAAPRTVSGGAKVRVLPGPQLDDFPADALEVLQRTRFTVTSQSDRMGYRLVGGTIPRIEGREMISDVTFTGALQVPPSGDPILLMSDRQTTGGYPQIATVITADLPIAGQLAPGDWIEFEVCSRHQAMSALIAQEGSILALQ
jgi:KipI family sensor histidine kinase inhibitor